MQLSSIILSGNFQKVVEGTYRCEKLYVQIWYVEAQIVEVKSLNLVIRNLTNDTRICADCLKEQRNGHRKFIIQII